MGSRTEREVMRPHLLEAMMRNHLANCEGKECYTCRNIGEYVEAKTRVAMAFKLEGKSKAQQQERQQSPSASSSESLDARHAPGRRAG